MKYPMPFIKLPLKLYGFLIAGICFFTACSPGGKGVSIQASMDKNSTYSFELESHDNQAQVALYVLMVKCNNKSDYTVDSIDFISYKILTEAMPESWESIEFRKTRGTSQKLNFFRKGQSLHSIEIPVSSNKLTVRDKIELKKHQLNELFQFTYFPTKQDTNEEYAIQFGAIYYRAGESYNWEEVFRNEVAKSYAYKSTAIGSWYTEGDRIIMPVFQEAAN